MSWWLYIPVDKITDEEQALPERLSASVLSGLLQPGYSAFCVHHVSAQQCFQVRTQNSGKHLRRIIWSYWLTKEHSNGFQGDGTFLMFHFKAATQKAHYKTWLHSRTAVTREVTQCGHPDAYGASRMARTLGHYELTRVVGCIKWWMNIFSPSIQ